jgi:hypothetical protein
MALPELIANSPVPGVRENLSTLKVELTEAGLEMELEAVLPTALQKAGQWRALIGTEIILCEGKAESTKKVKILERGAEGSTKVAHVVGSKVYHILTAEALNLYTRGLAFEKSVAMAYKKAKQKIPDAAYTTVTLDTKIKDPGNNIELTKGCYVVPSEGYYDVSGTILMTLATNTVLYSAIYVGSAKRIQGSDALSTGLTEETTSSVGGIVFCKAGEEITLRAYQHNTVAKEQETSGENEAVNVLSIMRVGEGPEGAKGTTGATGPGTTWKNTVALATTGALPANSVSGETIVSTGKENLEIDGNKIAISQRILVKNQAESKNDGLYEVIKKGGAAELWELKRTTDANTTGELQDATVAVEKGTKLEGCHFKQIATVTTVGTTAQNWLPDGCGVWEKPESTTSAVESSTIEMRLENNGSTVRMRGKFTAKEIFTPEKNLFISKALYRPSEETWVVAADASTGGAGIIQIEPNGECKWKSFEVSKGSIISLNVTYDLT